MYAVHRLEKYKRSAVYGIQVERTRQELDGINRARSDIDQTATGQNITLIACDNFNKEISRRIKVAGVKERKDSVVMIGAIYTASRDYFTLNPSYVELSKEERDAIELGEAKDTRTADQKTKYLYDEKAQQFFEECLQFHIEKYGAPFDARIDMDETTPHLQLYGVPLVERIQEDGAHTMHLSAKDLIGNRADLRKRQNEFHEQIGKPRGFERGELTDWEADPKERKKHEKTHEHKKRVQREELQQLKEDIADNRTQLLAAQEATEQAKREQATQEATAAAQAREIARNDLTLEQQQKEAHRLTEAAEQAKEKETRARIKLEKQAQASQAIARSSKRRLFRIKQYHLDKDAIDALKKIVNTEPYTPKERLVMQREANKLQRAREQYEAKEAQLETEIEQRVREEVRRQRYLDKNRIEQLERQVTQSRDNASYLEDKLLEMGADYGLEVDDIERRYRVNLSGAREDRHR